MSLFAKFTRFCLYHHFNKGAHSAAMLWFKVLRGFIQIGSRCICLHGACRHGSGFCETKYLPQELKFLMSSKHDLNNVFFFKFAFTLNPYPCQSHSPCRQMHLDPICIKPRRTLNHSIAAL